MADVAAGVNSPCCGTFSTVAGSYSDEQLSGPCGRCGASFTAPNPSYVAPAAQHKVITFQTLGPNGQVGIVTISGTDFTVDCQGVVLASEPPAPNPSVEPEPTPEATVVSEEPPAGPADG